MNQPSDAQPPTILVAEVRNWCSGSDDCASVVLTFVPGASGYFDRVRLEPIAADASSLVFSVPDGVTATYWDRGSHSETKVADGDAIIRATEALFTRVR